MNRFLTFVLLLSSSIASFASDIHRLYANQTMASGTIAGYICTSYLSMQADGNLVIYYNDSIQGCYKKVRWASGTQNNPGAYLKMQADGNLVILTKDGRAIWSSGTSGAAGGNPYAAFQSDQNLVVRSNQAIWSTPKQPAGAYPYYGYRVVPTLYQGGSSVVSPNGIFTVLLQGDGNLVLYSNYGAGGLQRALWATGYRGAQAVVQPDANYVLYATATRAAWASNTAGRGIDPMLALHDRGDMVLYADVPQWDIYGPKVCLGCEFLWKSRP